MGILSVRSTPSLRRCFRNPHVIHYGGRLLGSACAKSYNIPRARSPNPRFPLNVVKATYGDSLHNGLKSAKKDIE
ncbi:MAG: hypothetical protein IIT54_05050 [Acetobacter sp.]|nr:hypothetical protein [Acetobacter sp.]